MTHYTTSYAGMNRKEADEKAIADMRDYLGNDRFESIVAAIDVAKQSGPIPVHSIRAQLELLAGITGYPLGAFCRRYFLEDYRAWMHSGDDAVMTDEEGFPIAQKH